MYFFIDHMHVDDLPDVHRIDAQSFPYQWSTATYINELRAPQHSRYVVVRVSPHLPGSSASTAPVSPLQRLLNRWRTTVVAPAPRLPIAGHAGIWLSVDDGHITTIAVHPDYRRQGVGELLMLGLIDQAYDLNAQQLTLEVRVSNIAAQNLYVKFGFRHQGERKRYYTDNGEDASIMWTDDIHSAAFRERVHELRQQLYRRLQTTPVVLATTPNPPSTPQ